MLIGVTEGGLESLAPEQKSNAWDPTRVGMEELLAQAQWSSQAWSPVCPSPESVSSAGLG